MEIPAQENREQATLWNGAAGRGWVEAQELLDAVFNPFESLLLDAVAARSACRVLDVGCGTGATTLGIARRLGAAGRCTGIDISAAMLDSARARAARAGVAAEFIRADAQAHAFEAAHFDMIVSRFGVMFFDDPIAAFANLRRAARAGAGLCALAWRGAEENPFMTAAERAAAPLLPSVPARVAHAPGQFAFADRNRVEQILARSGWGAIDIRPVDIACRFAVAELERWFTQLGPLGRVLREMDAAARTRISSTVRAAFDPYVHGDDVRFVAACWMIGARAVAAPASDGAPHD